MRWRAVLKSIIFFPMQTSKSLFFGVIISGIDKYTVGIFLRDADCVFMDQA